MKEFNMKQWLVESKSGMYSKTVIKEHQFEDAWTLGKEIAKAHPELAGEIKDGDVKKYQDNIFKYAGEMLQGAGVSLNMVRGLAMDEDWAMELVTATLDALGRENLKELNPTALGAPQAAADAKMQQQDDENEDMVNNVSMGVAAEGIEDEAAYGNIPSADKVAPIETELSKYLDILHAHDWFHHFSDDHRIWQRGQTDKENLKALYNTLAPNDKQKAMDAFIDKYLQVYSPKDFPGAANNVKYLTTDTFKGSI